MSIFSTIRNFFTSDLGKKLLGVFKWIGASLIGIFTGEFIFAKIKSKKAERIKNKAIKDHDEARTQLNEHLKLLCDTKCSIYAGFGGLAELIEQIQQRPELILPLKGVDLPEFKPVEFKKLAFEAEALVGGAGGAIVGSTICMAVMGTGAIAGGILGSGFVLCAMGVNMVNRACDKKKQAEQIREDVKCIVEFYGKLSDASDSYRKDLKKVQTQFTKYLNKVARILERKVYWEDFSNAERRHVENAVMSELIKYSEQTFESIKHINEYGEEYWLARELQPVLEYAQWRRFSEAIERAKLACKNSGFVVDDHFADVGKMVDIGSGAEREIDDVMLSRYACYLIVMNGDPRKEVIAIGQSYFAVKTRQQELIDNYEQMTEDQKRLAIRNEMIAHNKSLAEAAQMAGIADQREYAIFQNKGYQGLYGGLGAKEIHARKGLKKSQKILDHMGSTELAANLFRATQTDEKLRRENIHGKQAA